MVETSGAKASGAERLVAPERIAPNPNNPRRYFNEEALDLLRTSIQEVGILVPLIVHEFKGEPGAFVLLDGERRLICALTLGLDDVPVSVIEAPTALDGLLRMFNIHAVREEWPLISIALSLQEVIDLSGEERETRLAEMTGLTRSAVRRAKRLLSLPDSELDLIRREAHLERSKQIHREDLYIEVIAAESVLRRKAPEVMSQYPRDHVIRQFVRKREEGHLRAVTGFRDAAKLAAAHDQHLIPTSVSEMAIETLVEDVTADPTEVYAKYAESAIEQRQLVAQVSRIDDALLEIETTREISDDLVQVLGTLRDRIDRILGGQ